MPKVLSLVLCTAAATLAWPVDEPATLEEIAALKTRLASLEAENAGLKAQVEASNKNDVEVRPSPRGLTFGAGLPAPDEIVGYMRALLSEGGIRLNQGTAGYAEKAPFARCPRLPSLPLTTRPSGAHHPLPPLCVCRSSAL